MGLEQAIGTLYEKYAEQFVGLTEFWSRLAKEEYEHARWLGALEIYVDQGHLFWGAARFSEPAVQRELDKVRDALNRVAAGDMRVVEALKTAGDLESSLLEAGFYDTVESSAPKFRKIAKALSAATREHSRLIYQLLGAPEDTLP